MLRAVAPTGIRPDNADPEQAVRAMREASWDLIATMRTMLADAGVLGADVGLRQVEHILGLAGRKQEDPARVQVIGTNWDLVNEAVLEWVLGDDQVFGTGYADQVVTQMLRTRERHVRRAIADWIRTGGTRADLIRALEPMFDGRRAEMVATTEVTRAYAEGNRIAWAQSGVVEAMEWATANDERVCPICAPLGGLTVQEGQAQPASVADQLERAVTAGLDGGFVHPGGSGGAARYQGQTYRMPPAHPRCRCWVRPVVSGFEVPPPTSRDEIRTSRDAQRYLESRYPDIYWEVDQVDDNLIHDLVAEIDETLDEYPEIGRALNGLGTMSSQRARDHGFTTRETDGIPATSWYTPSTKVKYISLNPRYWEKNGDLVHEIIDPPERMQKWLVGGGSARSIVRHELGHILHYRLSEMDSWTITPYVDDSGLGIVSETLYMWLSKHKPTYSLSGYALRNKNEAFAEAFTALKYRPRRRWPVFVRRFNRLINILRRSSDVGDLSSIRWVSEISEPDERRRAMEALDELRQRLEL